MVTIIDALTAFNYDRLGYEPYPLLLPVNGLLRILPDPVKQWSIKAARFWAKPNADGWKGSRLEGPSREFVAELERLDKDFAMRNANRSKFYRFVVALPSNLLNSISI